MLSMNMPLLVIDTNVFIASMLARRNTGASREVIRRCLKGCYRPLFGEALFNEYQAVLSREALLSKSPLTVQERAEVWAAMAHVGQWSRIYFLWRPNLPDEADNHLIELAVAGGASAIVTQNIRDLKRSELRFPEIQILTPKECLEVFPCRS
jgi:putative PIN family toxin of toxin-antitoxin system